MTRKFIVSAKAFSRLNDEVSRSKKESQAGRCGTEAGGSGKGGGSVAPQRAHVLAALSVAMALQEGQRRFPNRAFISSALPHLLHKEQA